MKKPRVTCLGFGLASKSDQVRLNALSKKFKVTAVNEDTNSTADKRHKYSHYSHTWKKPSSIEDTKPEYIYLDYFFMQNGWWQGRYGTSWFLPKSGFVYIAFLKCPQLQMFVLPIDNPSNKREKPGMLELLEKNEVALKLAIKKDANIDVSFRILNREQALSSLFFMKSDMSVNELIPVDRGSCLFQLEKYTRKDTAFIVIEKMSPI